MISFKRRWLRFSVRTLLVAVTICCVWLGWQVSIVRERKAAVKLLDHLAGPVSFSGYVDPPYVNIVRRMLGDVPPLYSLHIYDATLDEIQRIKNAFPEVVDFRTGKSKSRTN
jgi:hypothetical protein